MARAASVESAQRVPSEGEHVASTGDYLLPSMPRRDWAAVVVGLLGMIATGWLAVDCGIGDSLFSGTCAIRALIGLAAFYVAVFHTVGLLVMGSLRYRGIWEKVTADFVLIFIPIAVLASALLEFAD